MFNIALSHPQTMHLLLYHTHTFLTVSYVFDGKPPEMKSGELAKRAEKRAEAEKGLAKAQEEGEHLLHCVALCDHVCMHDNCTS